MRVSLATKKVDTALKEWKGDVEKVKAAVIPGMGFTGNVTTLETVKTPKEFLQFLLDHSEGLTEKQRSSLFIAVNGVSADIDTILTKPADAQTMISSLRVNDEYNAEYMIAGRWYPVRLSSQYFTPGKDNPAVTIITLKLKMVDSIQEQTFYVTEYMFQDEDGNPKPLTGKELLDKLGFRHLQQDLVAYKNKLFRAEKRAEQDGKVVAVLSPVLVHQEAFFYGGKTFTEVPLGSKEIPKKVVIESQLESLGTRRMGRWNPEAGSVPVPFVRVFALELKRYAYVDVDDIQEYQFDKQALDRLVLPAHEKSIISTLFHANVSNLFGDILQDKHGGMIILANGSTGVGKTLTAEVFSEITERPLYVMEMCELGIKVEEMEKKLAVIFQRVTKWNAILLMDEADVFLAKRGESLERSVIVGIFLRLMDYYKGLLFLTSNRAEVIDPAFKSRITIRINYPDLDRESRRQIWDIMLKMAGIEVSDGLDGIPDNELNGRQIRNMVRLIRVIHGTQVTSEQIRSACEFACK